MYLVLAAELTIWSIAYDCISVRFGMFLPERKFSDFEMKTKKGTAPCGLWTTAYLHGEVEGHEFTNGLQTGQGRSHCDTSETHLGNRGINYTLGTEFVEEAS